LYEIKAQAKTLHVVYVAGGYAEELFEHFMLKPGGYANAVVGYTDLYAPAAVAGLYDDLWCAERIFLGVVDDVADGLREQLTVAEDVGCFGAQVQLYVAVALLYFQLEGFGAVGEQLVYVEVFQRGAFEVIGR
jgi:hypothetical protein